MAAEDPKEFIGRLTKIIHKYKRKKKRKWIKKKKKKEKKVKLRS